MEWFDEFGTNDVHMNMAWKMIIDWTLDEKNFGSTWQILRSVCRSWYRLLDLARYVTRATDPLIRKRAFLLAIPHSEWNYTSKQNAPLFLVSMKKKPLCDDYPSDSDYSDDSESSYEED
jgi:hypothetical protein